MLEITKALYEAKESPQEGDVITYNGRTYRKVKRKAIKGEKVIVTSKLSHYGYAIGGYEIGDVYEVIRTTNWGDVFVTGKYKNGKDLDLATCEYAVLEPTEQPQHDDTTPQLLEIIGNLARRVVQLEKRVDANTALLVESWESIDDLECAVESNEEDIAMLDERSQMLVNGGLREYMDAVNKNFVTIEDNFKRMNRGGCCR